MPDLGRHETGLAIESAWTYFLKLISAIATNVPVFTGEFRVDQEIPEKYCQVVCTEIVPANALAFDKIEICTVELRAASSKQIENSGDYWHWRDIILGAIRSRLFYTDDLAADLETGLSKRGPSTSTSNEPLKIYHALYQTETMSYYNIDDPHYDIRVARLQTVVGPDI